MACPTKTHFQRTSGSRSWFDTFYRVFEPKGNVFFVHHQGAGGTTGGRTPEEAVTTLQAAIDLCTANNGDTVIVLAGHTEALIAAGTVTLSKAGVHVIGEGIGRERPVFTYTTAAAASFDVTAADCLLKNLVFSAVGVDAVTAMVNVSAADVWIEDCEFEHANATNQAALGILTTAAADRLKVRRCHFYGTSDAGTAAAIRLVGGTGIVIEDNVCTGAYAATGCINNITTACVMLTIRRNGLLNITADGNNKVIVLDGSTTGLIVNNAGGIIDSTSPAPVTAAAAFVGGNWWSSAAGVTASVLM